MHRPAAHRLSVAPILAAAALGLSLGCASGLPAVLTSTDSDVAIEFARDGNLSEASKLAQEACEKHGKNAKFEKVDMTATPDTRVAKFTCVAEATTLPADAEAAPSN
jgi:hypothetical protein